MLVAGSAVVAGAKSFAAIGQWAKKAPQGILARLGARTTTAFALRIAPLLRLGRAERVSETNVGSPSQYGWQ
ncbi:hypothetical protein ACFY3M_04940 [Streptomyces mirabilis]|uniref:hypothetical protein n=1 Tax=Streptomyces mirabilis TaxID=68239 RepID=UPI0036B05031